MKFQQAMLSPHSDASVAFIFVEGLQFPPGMKVVQFLSFFVFEGVPSLSQAKERKYRR